MALVKYNNNSISTISSAGQLASGSLVPIKTLTASSSSTLSFVDGSNGVVLDNTYKEYLFTFNNIHPNENGVALQFNLSTDSGSNYNVTKTTTSFRAYHDENNSATALTYETSDDLAQSTGFQKLSDFIGNENDECASGTLTLFNPSSPTFVKHFIANANTYQNANYSINTFVSGYGNTTSSIDAVQFKLEVGNIDAGDICLYGIA